MVTPARIASGTDTRRHHLFGPANSVATVGESASPANGNPNAACYRQRMFPTVPGGSNIVPPRFALPPLGMLCGGERSHRDGYCANRKRCGSYRTTIQALSTARESIVPSAPYSPCNSERLRLARAPHFSCAQIGRNNAIRATRAPKASKTA